MLPGNASCSSPLCGSICRASPWLVTGSQGSTSVLYNSLFASALPAQEGPGVSEALSLEAVKQLGRVGVVGCLLFISFVLQELLLRGKQVDPRGSQAGEKSRGTDSPTPKSDTATSTTALAMFPSGKGSKDGPDLFFSPSSKTFDGFGREWRLGKGCSLTLCDGDHGLLCLWL